MSYLLGLSRRDTGELADKVKDATLNPEDFKPGFFTGLGDTTQMANTLTRSLVAEPAIVGALAESTIAGSNPLTKEHEAFWFDKADEAVKWRKSLRIDPATHGAAAQVVDSIFGLLPQAALTGAVGTGVISGISETAGLIDEGKPLDTAAKLGAVTGITNAAGVAAPAAIGSTLGQRVASGAAANTIMGGGADAAKSAILDDAGYHQEAQQFSATDPKARAIDAILGAAFGGLAHLHAPKAEQVADQVRVSDIDAALTLNEAQRIAQTAPEIRGETSHVDSLYRSIDQLTRGEEVSDTGLFSTSATRADQADSSIKVVDDIVQEIRQEIGVINDRVEYHPGIVSMASALQENGGVAYVVDENQVITGRTESINPEWFKNNAFVMRSADGSRDLATTPTVSEIKQAVSDYSSGKRITKRQTRIVETLHDIATHEEAIANEQFSAEQAGLAREIHGLVLAAREVGISHEIESAIARGDLKSYDDILAWKGDIDELVSERNTASNEPPTAPLQDNTRAADQERQSVPEQTPSQEGDTPEITAARQATSEFSDAVVHIENDDGSITTLTAAEAWKMADDEASFADQADAAVNAAITCFFKHGG